MYDRSASILRHYACTLLRRAPQSSHDVWSRVVWAVAGRNNVDILAPVQVERRSTIASLGNNKPGKIHADTPLSVLAKASVAHTPFHEKEIRFQISTCPP